MNSPSPALRQLYRHAATPARWLAQLRQADALIERFEFDLRRAGLDAEVALEPLLTPVSLDAALGGTRLTSGAPATTGSGQSDQIDARPSLRRVASDRSEPTGQSTAALRPDSVSAAPISPATVRAAGSHLAAEVGDRFDPQSHPRLALLQTLAPVDLTSLQRRYGLLDPTAPDAAARPSMRTASGIGAPQHSAADAQDWLRALARRAHAPEAADQPLAARFGLGSHGDNSPSGQQPRPFALGAVGSAATSADTPVAHRAAPDRSARTQTEPLDTSAPVLGGLQRLLQRFDPARAAAPSTASADAATSALSAAAGSQRSAESTRRTEASDLAGTRHPTAAAAAALRTELRTELWRSAGPDRDTQGAAMLDPNQQPDRPDRSTAPAARPASAGTTWSAPMGGFRGLAALGRAAESGSATPSALPADTTPPRQPFGPNADTLRDGIDAEQLAELLRQQARRHGIDLTEFEP